MTMRLRDGRRLAWYEWGPGSGRPVLFCTGAAMSGSVAFGAGHLRDLDLRLIAFDRPGLGSSDQHPGKTLSSWVDDIQQVISARAIFWRGSTVSQLIPPIDPTVSGGPARRQSHSSPGAPPANWR